MSINMSRKIIASLLALMILLTGCGKKTGNDVTTEATEVLITPTDATEPTETTVSKADAELDSIRSDMNIMGNIAAVAYLGYYEGNYNGLHAYLETVADPEVCSFLFEIDKERYVELEGNELYCIIPFDGQSDVTVYEWIVDESNDFEGEPGDVMYYSEEGKPLLVKGNVSEIMPNIMVEIIDPDESVIEYTPCLSGMDGTLVVPLYGETILDITPYENLGYDFSFDPDTLLLTEYWEIEAYSSSEDIYNGSFAFREDGSVEFLYGLQGEIYNVFYEGVFYESEDPAHPEDTYIIELALIENNSRYLVEEELVSAFKFISDPSSIYIDMEYIEGDPLFGIEDQTYYYLIPTVG